MNNTIISIVLVLILIAGAYYFIANKSSSKTPVASNTVSIQNFSFNPSMLTVKTGIKVTWTNNDAVAHTITSDSGDLLNSPTLAPSQSFSFTFTNPGSVSYHCAIHPMMKGTISVTPQSKDGFIESCRQTGGTWKEESNPCGPTCDFQRRKLNGENISCITVIVPNCECGKDKCWNGSSCEPL